ncbi:hypothetical protein [Paraflavitalea speifideaquila]|uniref:hypothetical protein n=1 Tax=Paraflavitalea speifideaquila TaxID=3076558 RepID=UPI0028EA2847|nr:hypothetical protein [Paraflavitalea speifideiaquila]
MKQVLVLILIVACVATSCKKDSFITGHANLSTSADTLHFDTVFTSVGSVTHLFRIFNDNDQKLKLSNVTLAGGASSVFRINVDGTPGPTVSDIEIEANDSLYVFVSVKIDPTSENLPFVLRDSIHIQFNNQERWVQLEAWGQNAHFLRSRLIANNETWTNDKPYVIMGGLQVDTNITLTILKGCRIYLHANAPFIVDGSLLVTGEKYDSTRVIFQGDRIDEPYRNYPGAWPGIYFRGESKDNYLQFAVIKNAYQGIIAIGPTINANPKIRLSETIIDNCYDAGIQSVQSDIRAQNCLISNCGKNMVLAMGGNYEFNHCTSVAYSNTFIQHKEPVLLVTDFFQDGNNVLTAPLTATFTNCIFWAENSVVEDEVITSKRANGPFNLSFQNCLWKVKNNPANTTTSNIIANQAPFLIA